MMLVVCWCAENMGKGNNGEGNCTVGVAGLVTGRRKIEEERRRTTVVVGGKQL